MLVTKESTIPELKALLEPEESMDRVTYDPSDETSRFELVDGKMRFHHNRESYGITGDAYTYFGRLMRIPSAYLGRTPHELMVPHVNYWLANSPPITYGVQDGVVKLVSKGETAPVSVGLVLDVLEELKKGQELSVHHISHDPQRTSFSITTSESRKAAELKVGDVLDTGVTISTSYFGMEPLAISAYVHRLKCTNGMVSTEHAYRHSRRNSDTDPREWIYESLYDAFAASDEELDSLARLRSFTFDGHLSTALKSVFDEYKVSASIQDSILTAVIDQVPETMYDLLNIITFIASNDDEILKDGRLSTQLMRIAGSLSTHPEMCGSCHRIISV